MCFCFEGFSGRWMSVRVLFDVFYLSHLRLLV